MRHSVSHPSMISGGNSRITNARRRHRHYYYRESTRTSSLVHNKNQNSRLSLFRADDSNDVSEDETDDVTEEEDDDDDYDEDGNYSDDSIDFVWEVGNVEADFQALEQAINFENAEFNLLEAERVEMMDAFAKQRRLFLKDLHAFVTRPLRWSLVFVVIQRILQRKSSNHLAQFIARHRLVTLPWDIHFWAIVVLAPILFLQVKKRTMAPPEPMPEELQKLDPEYLPFVTTYHDWEDSETSYRDYVLCLSEQWVSAVKSMAWFGLLRLGCFAAMRMSILSNIIRTVPYFSPTATAFLQFLTRLGAMASIYQFPKLLFQLQREQQPRPVRGDVSALQKLVNAMLRWGLPIGIASDLSQILMAMPKRGLVAFFGMAVAFLSVMEIIYSPSRKPAPPSVEPRKRAMWQRLVLNAVQLICATGAMAFFAIKVTAFFFFNTAPKKMVLLRIPWLQVISNGALLLALIRYVCLIGVLARLRRECTEKVANLPPLSLL